MLFQLYSRILLIALILSGCLKEDDAEEAPACAIGEDCFPRDEALLNVENISLSDSERSHNFGQNCMSCHQDRGPGKGLFTVAGSIYATSEEPWTEGATVRMFADRARTQVVLEVPVDKLGNFYSTESIDMPEAGLFVSVFNADGTKKQDMRSPKISLACNTCHAGSAKVILKP